MANAGQRGAAITWTSHTNMSDVLSFFPCFSVNFSNFFLTFALLIPQNRWQRKSECRNCFIIWNGEKVYLSLLLRIRKTRKSVPACTRVWFEQRHEKTDKKKNNNNSWAFVFSLLPAQSYILKKAWGVYLPVGETVPQISRANPLQRALHSRSHTSSTSQLSGPSLLNKETL